jgi:DNA processing protein
MLIRDGALLVRSAQDVIDAIAAIAPVQSDLPLETPDAKPQRSLRETAALHSQILSRLGPSPIAEDQLIRDLAATPTTIAPAIMDLELDGKITRHAGGLLARAD